MGPNVFGQRPLGRVYHDAAHKFNFLRGYGQVHELIQSNVVRFSLLMQSVKTTKTTFLRFTKGENLT